MSSASTSASLPPSPEPDLLFLNASFIQKKSEKYAKKTHVCRVIHISYLTYHSTHVMRFMKMQMDSTLKPRRAELRLTQPCSQPQRCTVAA